MNRKTTKTMKKTTYKIIRFYQDKPHRSKCLKTGLTLEEAQAHCSNPATSGDGWFDGFNEEYAEDPDWLDLPNEGFKPKTPPTVRNMVSASGNNVANQFIISYGEDEEIFQSYKTVIARRTYDARDGTTIALDVDYWNYSVTTSKYRNKFLDMTTQEIKQAIKDGSIELVNLNEVNHCA